MPYTNGVIQVELCGNLRLYICNKQRKFEKQPFHLLQLDFAFKTIADICEWFHYPILNDFTHCYNKTWNTVILLKNLKITAHHVDIWYMI